MPDNRPGQQPGQGSQQHPSHDNPQTGQHDPNKRYDDPSKQQPGHQNNPQTGQHDPNKRHDDPSKKQQSGH